MSKGETGRPEAGSVSATDAQNHFGAILSRAASEGAVFIRRYDRPTAVLLSIDAYRELSGGTNVDLEGLTREFEAMLSRQQTEDAAAATDALFDMGADELGRAAVQDAPGEDE